MLNLKQIVNETKVVKQKLSMRNFDLKLIDEIIDLATKRSHLMTQVQTLEAKRNNLSTSIGRLKTSGVDTESLMKDVIEVKNAIAQIKGEEIAINNTIEEKLAYIPNLPSDNTPPGQNEDDNKVIAEHANLGQGKISHQNSHDEIAVRLNIVDFTRSVKMSGTRFWSYIGLGAKLVRALINFMIDEHIKRGYQEINPPLIVNAPASFGVGQLPKFQDDLFKIANNDAYLISTGEVPLTNFYAQEIITLLGPIKLTAYTPCFRQEAGSGGKDTKGLIRGHQFHKVELVKFVNHHDSKHEFKSTIEDAKNILQKLELPFQELQLCSGDLGFSAQETVDLEVWFPSQNRYREVSSISFFGEFQARRLKIRYRDENNKMHYAMTINGSGLAIDRTIAAILENYQNKDGSVSIPKVLLPYFDNIKVIT